MCLLQRIMERANHINIAMIDDIDTNGTGRSKVITAIDQKKQQCGSTVSFHNIQYKVQLRGGFFCKMKTNTKEILVDLKLVVKTVHPLCFVSFFCASCICVLFGLLYYYFLVTQKCYNCKFYIEI